jgi:molecular chaperone IbpA
MDMTPKKQYVPEGYPKAHVWEPPKQKVETNPFRMLDSFLHQWTVGFDPLFAHLEAVKNSVKSNYPPYNIIQVPEGYVIELAVAGFSKEDLSVELLQNVLQIKGTKDGGVWNPIHQGISNRNFEQKFIVADDLEVGDVSLENGLMIIKINRPESQVKARKIEIK